MTSKDSILTFKTGRSFLYLEPVSRGTWVAFHDHGIPIQEDGFFNWKLFNEPVSGVRGLDLARLFLVLQHLFGPSRDPVDESKGSFRFPFHLVVGRGWTRNHYGFQIADVKGNPCFMLLRLVKPEEKLQAYAYIPPFDDELSRNEIRHLTVRFVAHLGEFLELRCLRPRHDFFRRIESPPILYGYRDGEPFVRYFEHFEEVPAAIDELVAAGVQKGGASVPCEVQDPGVPLVSDAGPEPH